MDATARRELNALKQAARWRASIDVALNGQCALQSKEQSPSK
jgi:hypothetical protein